MVKSQIKSARNNPFTESSQCHICHLTVYLQDLNWNLTTSPGSRIVISHTEQQVSTPASGPQTYLALLLPSSRPRQKNTNKSHLNIPPTVERSGKYYPSTDANTVIVLPVYNCQCI